MNRRTELRHHHDTQLHPIQNFDEIDTSQSSSVDEIIEASHSPDVEGMDQDQPQISWPTPNDSKSRAILRLLLQGLSLKEKMNCSQSHFEEMLLWGKSIIRECHADQYYDDLFPTTWSMTQSLLRSSGYGPPKVYHICLDDSHPCNYAVMENSDDACKYCGKFGNIKYYYCSVTEKVKRWVSSSSMCQKLLGHWDEQQHWISNEDNWGYPLKKEVWDGKRFSELSYFWDPDKVHSVVLCFR